jgi:hypothetical protein
MRSPSLRVLKDTASHREKRLSSVNKQYDPNAWRYDETGVPKPPVGEAELRRAHVVSLSTNTSTRQPPQVVGPTGSSRLGPYGAAASSSNSPKSSVHSTPGSSFRTASSGEVMQLSSPAPPPAGEVESRDMSAPEDLQIVRALREEVLRLQNGLPSHDQSSLEVANARLERECEGLRRRVEGYQLTMEQFGRRMAEMEAENVTLKVQVEIMHKPQAASRAAAAGGGDETDPSAALLQELSDLLRSERRKSRTSRGDVPHHRESDEGSGRDAPAPPAPQSPSDLLDSMRRANAVLEAELMAEAPEAKRPQRRAPFTSSTGVPLAEHSTGAARGGRQSRGEKQRDDAARDSSGRFASGPEPGAELTIAEARLAAADRAERRLRELEAELKQTKMEAMAEKMRQIEGRLNESLGKVGKPVNPFDSLSLDAQLEELGLCGGEFSPEHGGHSPERVD